MAKKTASTARPRGTSNSSAGAAKSGLKKALSVFGSGSIGNKTRKAAKKKK